MEGGSVSVVGLFMLKTNMIYIYIYIYTLFSTFVILFSCFVHFIRSIQFMAPPRGLSTPRTLKVKFENIEKQLVTKYVFFLRICIIFCMREAVTISYGSRILPRPPRPLKRPQNLSLLFASSNFYFFGLFFRTHLGYGNYTLPCRAH